MLTAGIVGVIFALINTAVAATDFVAKRVRGGWISLVVAVFCAFVASWNFVHAGYGTPTNTNQLSESKTYAFIGASGSSDERVIVLQELGADKMIAVLAKTSALPTEGTKLVVVRDGKLVALSAP